MPDETPIEPTSTALGPIPQQSLPIGPSEQAKTGNPQPLTESAQRVFAHGWSGPLPPPSSLMAYRDVNPTYPDQIVRMALREQRMEAKRLNAEIESQRNDGLLQRRGQWMALGLVVLFIAVGVGMTVAGHEKFGLACVGGVMAAVVLSFLGGRALAIVERHWNRDQSP